MEVGVGLTLEKQVVEIFFLAGFFEGENALHNNEEDDSDGEHVDILTLVLLAFLDLGCHVGHGSAVGLKSINVLVASESEVGKFQVEVVIDKDVLELQVSVHNFAAVHVLD